MSRIQLSAEGGEISGQKNVTGRTMRTRRCGGHLSSLKKGQKHRQHWRGGCGLAGI